MNPHTEAILFLLMILLTGGMGGYSLCWLLNRRKMKLILAEYDGLKQRAQDALEGGNKPWN